ncbi:type I DNA topoisomerase [Treponema phagedenis]|uniref:type I DNA topoisomerase n=1 Tax=Treponema phagedenis TaxID=162 RepID=UPI0011E610EF|nr:type I DNA topoisomerase [Treponema phagedenis]QEJ94748.1 type I DNA topoisomerase [Treponema phagedenis]QEK00654.1 type I DNA topoisomerase [Treponema phagedenis]QEK05663.1 type I DNA topoisomerase [Treponema phagedenis]
MAKKMTTKKEKQPKWNLVIVESPAKAKTIEKYLGKNYVVKASMGHLIDLPKSRIAIDVENNFEPEYITVRGRAKILKELQKDAKKAKQVLLASDNDREGEAIAYHLANSIHNFCDTPVSRIVFNEITPQAIKDAVQEPMDIDEAKVEAQRARRVLDRLVGYNLSPLLWKKVKNGLSAGRVQSVALRLICDREVEVENFLPEEYWSLEGSFKKGKSSFSAQLVRFQDSKPELKNEKQVLNIIETLKNSESKITDIKITEKAIRPKPPFTTSTLQQVAANRLGFTSRKTMQLAQQLYEGIAVGSSRVGLITYMRTDSVRISQVALDEARKWLSENSPNELPEKPNHYAVGQKAQDAHEGIRPTYIQYTPDYLKEYLNRDQHKLYSLIWERFIASQMTNAKTQSTSIEITVGDAVFRATATKLAEKGFYKFLKLLISKEEKGSSLPTVKIGDIVIAENFKPEQHFTQGPARYTDASIVKMLEEKGIGRPSTYAPIISVLLDRYYIIRNNKQLVPTELGRIINDILVANFNDIIDVNFTADMETKLDEVEEKKIEWQKLMENFYSPFIEKVDTVMENLDSMKGRLDEKTDFVCEKCGKKMVKKLGRFGFFLACEGFPECRNTKSIPLAKCPREGCGGDIIARKAKKRGREFYGCTNYPKCDFISYFKPINATCPKCGWFLVEKYDKKNGNYNACINPDCEYLHSVVEGVEDTVIERDENE